MQKLMYITLNHWMKQITLYVDENLYQQLTSLMSTKDRTLNYIANELMRQAIKEKNRKKKVEKQDN